MTTKTVTRESILYTYQGVLQDLPTPRRKLNYLNECLREIRDLLRTIRPLMREPLSRRYHLGEFITRVDIYNYQREEGIILELIERIKTTN